jgi:peptidoglycan hydrolase-like protein with peptidoglycan-binding domain
MNAFIKPAAIGTLALLTIVAVAPAPAAAEDTNDNSSVITELQAKIQSLTAELDSIKAQIRALVGANASSTPSLFGIGGIGHTLPPTASAVAHCELMTHALVRGATDATTNGEVSTLQKFLSEDPSIYPQKLVTGFYGPITASAVAKFQLKNGVVPSLTSSAAGVVGPMTRGAIFSWCGRAFGGNGGGNGQGNGGDISRMGHRHHDRGNLLDTRLCNALRT